MGESKRLRFPGASFFLREITPVELTHYRLAARNKRRVTSYCPKTSSSISFASTAIPIRDSGPIEALAEFREEPNKRERALSPRSRNPTWSHHIR
jgi:hypothetical protein